MEKQPPFAEIRQNLNLVMWIIWIYAMCLLPFIHSGFGPRGLGIEAIIAFVFMIGLASELRSVELLNFAYVWLAFAIWRRITADRSQATNYRGWPWLAQRLTFCRREFLLHRLEAIIAGLIGAALYHYWSPVVGRFVEFGSMALWMKAGLEAQMRRRLIESIRDGEILARQQAEMMRR